MKQGTYILRNTLFPYIWIYISLFQKKCFLIELSPKSVHLNFETKSERYDVLTFHCELHNNDELFVHWRMTKFSVGMEIHIFFVEVCS